MKKRRVSVPLHCLYLPNTHPFHRPGRCRSHMIRDAMAECLLLSNRNLLLTHSSEKIRQRNVTFWGRQSRKQRHQASLNLHCISQKILKKISSMCDHSIVNYFLPFLLFLKLSREFISISSSTIRVLQIIFSFSLFLFAPLSLSQS